MRVWVASFASNIGSAGAAFIVSHTLRTLVDTPLACDAMAGDSPLRQQLAQGPASPKQSRFDAN